jgi:hypothetical protein
VESDKSLGVDVIADVKLTATDAKEMAKLLFEAIKSKIKSKT